MPGHQITAAEAATDALLQVIERSDAGRATFSAVCDGGVLTTWREPGRARLGPDFTDRASDPAGLAYWTELHGLGEAIHETGGLDALDEAIMHIVQMDPLHSDWRAMVLESVWFDIGRAG
ncbi:hypothetical protein [Methylobacterium planeticum]|uniref:Uncharacterized protein n=1 Tax=Methylobacterium planeticum TaxID=2615211 RepID=A0A6N6MP49_9HYPH|nr:hypothetical protein [Methylobacterium planeticum]KAB1072260.1 hypothetical protein F6X51_16235 [Methylobacterium planeticum]